MHVGVIGTGYVGLVTGVCFAEMGNNVVLMDIDEDKIRCLTDGEVPIYEPGLEQMIARNVAEKRLSFTTDLQYTVETSLINFIAVGTPPDADGSADLTHVFDVARSIGRAINTYKIIVTKSTVPVGTTFKVRDIIAQETNHPFDVASNPEFLKEGNAVEDFMKPDRVVVGVEDVRAGEILKELYSAFVRTGKPVLLMDVLSSEMTKCGQRAARYQDIFHQRVVAPVRKGGCGHREGQGRHRIGPAYRPPVPLRRNWVRRGVFPQGRGCAWPHRP